MNFLFLAGFLACMSLGAQNAIYVGQQELPRITLFERSKIAALESIASSIAFLWIGAPRWAHIIVPSLGTFALGPSVVKGLMFKRKIALLQVPRVYDPKDFTDPLLYVTMFAHPFDKDTFLTSGATLWNTYNQLDDEQKQQFAQGLLRDLDYTSRDEGLQAVTQAKNYRKAQLEDLKKYSDIQERLQGLLSSSDEVSKKNDQLFYADTAVIKEKVQELIDSGSYCQPVFFDTHTKRITQASVSSWYADDFVYYYASWYGFELLQAYGRLLALQKIWQA